MDHRKLKENILKFSLDDCARGNQGYDRVLLQLFGYTGHGKSSFINSCKYVLEEDEKFIEHAEAQDTEGGHTLIRKGYELTKNITMVDNRGYNAMDNNFQIAGVYAQLGNFIPLDVNVEWRQNFKDMMHELEDAEPNDSDFLVPVFIHSVKCSISDKEMPELTTFMKNSVKMTGIVPIIVLTNKTSGNFFECEKKFKRMGAESVTAIENYTREENIKTLGRTTDILMVIDSALKNVKFQMEKRIDRRRERIECKKFLLQYVHESEYKKKEEEAKFKKPEAPLGYFGMFKRLFGY